MAKGPNDSVSLKEILEKGRLLDEIALATLTEKYYLIIFRYFSYRTKTREDAEDLTGEVFVRMVGAIRNQKGDFPAWLFRIARNLLIDYYRKRHKSKETSLEEIDDKALSRSSKYERETLTLEEIKKLFNFLTEEQKEVITLRFLENYSNEEVARIMDKSTGAVKALQFRGLSTLRNILKREGQYKNEKTD